MDKFAVNAISSLRIVGAVVILALLPSENWFAILAVMLIAFSSDWLDGRLARRWKAKSSFGVVYDPLADKVINLTVLWIVAVHYQSWPYWLAAVLITLYDVATNVMRYVSSRYLSGVMKTTWTAKLKTVVLMVALVAAVVGVSVEGQGWYATSARWLGLVMLLLATVLSMISLVEYLRNLLAKRRDLAAKP